jgi:hypothetical protein
MPARRAVLGAASAAALTLVLPLTLAGSTAQAVTNQCLNTPRPVSGLVGCGTLYTPYLGGGPHNLALTLTASSNSFLAPVQVEVFSGSSARQDWTFYQLCTRMSLYRSAAKPCGDGGKIDKNRFVIQYTPFGHQPPGGVNSQQSLCLDDDSRHVVLANCQSHRAYLQPGFPNPPYSDGTPPAVLSANPAEAWIFTPVHGGVTIRNAATGRYLDDNANGPAGTKVITWERNGSADQVWAVLGCTSPLTGMPGYGGC